MKIVASMLAAVLIRQPGALNSATAVVIDRTIARAAETSGSPAMIDAGISADVDNPTLALPSLYNHDDGASVKFVLDTVFQTLAPACQ